MSVADIRRSYDWSELQESTMARSPIVQLGLWIDDAVKASAIDPTAMTLATVDAQGRPSARIVLLKGYDENGLVFYTNYQSRKGQDLAANPIAALLFYWPVLLRQIRVEVQIGKTSAEQSDAYFYCRSLSSRICALSSPLSQEISRLVFVSR